MPGYSAPVIYLAPGYHSEHHPDMASHDADEMHLPALKPRRHGFMAALGLRIDVGLDHSAMAAHASQRSLTGRGADRPGMYVVAMQTPTTPLPSYKEAVESKDAHLNTFEIRPPPYACEHPVSVSGLCARLQRLQFSVEEQTRIARILETMAKAVGDQVPRPGGVANPAPTPVLGVGRGDQFQAPRMAIARVVHVKLALFKLEGDEDGAREMSEWYKCVVARFGWRDREEAEAFPHS